MLELTGGFRIGDVIWYGSLGPLVRFRIVGVHKTASGEESCEGEVIRSPYRQDAGYSHYVGAVVTLDTPTMYRLVERDVLALDWMRKENWSLGRLASA